MNSEPIAWCSVAPRESYQRLGGDESFENVWSIACFYIKKEFRDMGLIDLLIENSKKIREKKWREISGGLSCRPRLSKL